MSEDNPWRDAYAGSAKIRCESLAPTEGPEVSLDTSKLKRLVDIFALGGCRRLDESHRLRVLLKRSDWTKLTSTVGAQALRRRELPLLHVPDDVPPLKYLHGRHRLAACRLVLEPADQWWGVDFYLQEEIPVQLQLAHLIQFDNAQPYNDGVIFREICLPNKDVENSRKLWLSRLAPSPSKLRDLRQLLRQQRLVPLLLAFQDICPYEGLWQDFKLGTFHRILTMRCTEELTEYLEHIRQTWTQLLGEDRSYVDAYTVRCLQGRCPKRSGSDRAHVRRCLEDRTAFSWVTDETERDSILACLYGIDHMIPSLWTFLEDTKWLEPASRVIKSLLPSRPQGTVRRTLCDSFQPPQDGHENDFTTNYRKLWLYCLSHFAELDSVQPRRESRKQSQLSLRPHAEARWKLLHLAQSLGFLTSVVVSSDEPADVEEAVARSVVLNARPAEFYQISPETLRRTTEEVGRALGTVPANTRTRRSGRRVPPVAPKFDIKHRCGRVFEAAYRTNQQNMHIDNIYRPPVEEDNNDIVTAFAVSRDIFRAFFGFQAGCTLDIHPDSESDMRAPPTITAEDWDSVHRQDLLDHSDRGGSVRHEDRSAQSPDETRAAEVQDEYMHEDSSAQTPDETTAAEVQDEYMHGDTPPPEDVTMVETQHSPHFDTEPIVSQIIAASSLAVTISGDREVVMEDRRPIDQSESSDPVSSNDSTGFTAAYIQQSHTDELFENQSEDDATAPQSSALVQITQQPRSTTPHAHDNTIIRAEMHTGLENSSHHDQEHLPAEALGTQKHENPAHLMKSMEFTSYNDDANRDRDPADGDTSERRADQSLGGLEPGRDLDVHTSNAVHRDILTSPSTRRPDGAREDLSVPVRRVRSRLSFDKLWPALQYQDQEAFARLNIAAIFIERDTRDHEISFYASVSPTDRRKYPNPAPWTMRLGVLMQEKSVIYKMKIRSELDAQKDSEIWKCRLVLPNQAGAEIYYVPLKGNRPRTQYEMTPTDYAQRVSLDIEIVPWLREEERWDVSEQPHPDGRQ